MRLRSVWVAMNWHGCYSAGDTLDEAVTNTKEAIKLHIEGLLAAGEPLPAIHALADHKANPDYTRGVDIGRIEMSRLENVTERSGSWTRLPASSPSGSVEHWRVDLA